MYKLDHIKIIKLTNFRQREVWNYWAAPNKPSYYFKWQQKSSNL